jgi:transcriptional regulator with XRE-family HTH domain
MAIDRLHERIRHARIDAGLSQLAIAQELGVGRSAVSQWEQVGGTRPSIGNLTALGLLTATSLYWLLEGRGPMHHGFDPAADAIAAPDPTTPQELAVLQLYRRLSGRRRALALRLLEQMAELAEG